MENLVTLQGRTVIVTGAAQGIGRATVELALRLGSNVVGVDLNADGLADLAKTTDKSRFLPLTGSVSDRYRRSPYGLLPMAPGGWAHDACQGRRRRKKSRLDRERFFGCGKARLNWPD